MLSFLSLCRYIIYKGKEDNLIERGVFYENYRKCKWGYRSLYK